MTDVAGGQPSQGDASEAGAATPRPAANETKRPTDNKIDRPLETPKKDSRVGQWVAVLAAVIAAVAAITSALVAAHTSASTSRSQSHAAAVLAERQERRDAYAKFVADIEDLDTQETQIAYWFTRYQQRTNPFPFQVLQQSANNYNNAWSEYGRQEDIIELIDSPAVDTVDTKVNDAENTAHDMVNAFLIAGSSIDTTNAILVRLPELNKDNNEADSTLQALKDACQKDLQDLGYGDH